MCSGVVEAVEVEPEEEVLEVGLVAPGGQLAHHRVQEPGEQCWSTGGKGKQSRKQTRVL